VFVTASLVRVPGAGSMRMIARVSLVRVFAVLALVVGIALLQGTPCERDVAWSSQCTTAATQVFADLPITGDTASDLLEDLGGVSGACLAVLLAVLLAIAGLGRPSLFLVSAVSVPVPWQGPGRRPGVRLTQLCILRA
jgi:hypothetical protein